MSLYAREKWAIGRRLHAGRLRPRFERVACLSRLRRGDDAGFGIVEAVVSVALLALVVVPVTHLAIATESSSNALHLRVEASDLATQALETAQYQTANGVNPTAGVTTSTQYSGKDPFTVALDWELVAGTGAASTICIAPPGQLSSRIWTVKATVSWGHNGGQQGHVVATTLVSPALGRSRRQQCRGDRRAGLQLRRRHARDHDADQYHGHGFLRWLAVLRGDRPEQREHHGIGQHRLDRLCGVRRSLRRRRVDVQRHGLARVSLRRPERAFQRGDGNRPADPDRYLGAAEYGDRRLQPKHHPGARRRPRR